MDDEIIAVEVQGMSKECSICKANAVVAAKVSKGMQTANVYLCEKCLGRVAQVARVEILGSAILAYQKGQVIGIGAPLPTTPRHPQKVPTRTPDQNSFQRVYSCLNKSTRVKALAVCATVLVVIGIVLAIAPKDKDNNFTKTAEFVNSEAQTDLPVEDLQLTVSDVMNLPLIEAVEELKSEGFTNIQYDVDLSDDNIEKWFVTGQSIKAGERILPEKAIVLSCNMICQLRLNIKSDFNLLFSKYDIEITLDGEKIGTISNGETLSKDIEVLNGDHQFVFCKAGDSSLKLEKTITVNEDRLFGCKIAHSSDSMDMKNIVDQDLYPVEELEEAEPTNDHNEPPVQAEVNDYPVSMDEPDKTELPTDEPVENDENISLEASEAEKVEETPKEKKPRHPASYHSSGDRDIAKEGDSGVFSYKNSGKEYDRYYIIDFDENYVYSFSYGNGDIYCDRVKIDYGNLNDYIVTTYHADGVAWSEGLHFKWKYQPDNLVLQDRFDFEIEFKATDLDDALKYMSEMEIIDY